MNAKLIVMRLMCFLLLWLLLPVFATLAESPDARRTHFVRHGPHSGIIAHIYFDGHCWPPPHNPTCVFPGAYIGRVSIFTRSGRFVSFATPDGYGIFTASVHPGVYIMVPDDPDLASFATEVTVHPKEFAPVTILFPWELAPWADDY